MDRTRHADVADADLSHTVWRKSRRSNNGGECVEVADLATGIGVRDSKNPGAGHLTFTPDTWAAFTVAVKQGQHDR
ncbi:DUF397 domain-containing protein [Spirillospora sp. NBC_01491]|uniref:DUF397 domain-containing protein n=1 Tax=Spirillospora sp. NBC_01491 TaxID=2976007 RepID=UPI002E30C464|nr:DUF397 domain-containing protein [Spirillospora sp. NBC_01491]